MKVKQVAIVVKYFPSVSETFIVNQINALIDQGYGVTLFAYNQVENIPIHNSLLKHDLLNKVHYFIKPPVSKWRRFKSFIFWTWHNRNEIVWSRFFKTLNIFSYCKDAYTLKLFFEAQWFLLPYTFKIIHAHFGMNGERIAYLKDKGIIPNKVKLITTFHGYDLVPNTLKDYQASYKHILNQANAFTVNTPYLENLLQQVNINKTPCYILPVGLDTTFFKQTSSKKETPCFNILFCGKLISLKGPDLAVKIVKKLHELGHNLVRLHIIGEGMLRDKLKEDIIDLDLQDAVFLYGNQSQADLKLSFEQADVFLLPGRHDTKTGRAETQGLVIQEAQSMELPVVVSNVGGMKYGLIPGKTGFVVNENNVEEFVKAIEKLILNQELKINMGKKGRQFVEQYYDNSVLIEKLIEIYNEF
ncbi:glycosyltransferase family 4 protein [Xanthomarina sp. GH4-25]|uniref:glycosyltransferase family 4 protein n=1 Tax=Xanthomarina sp. GH4-25 TaxID=3349335 RepID=UPI003877D8E0